MMSCPLQQEWHKYCTAGWRRVIWILSMIQQWTTGRGVLICICVVGVVIISSVILSLVAPGTLSVCCRNPVCRNHLTTPALSGEQLFHHSRSSYSVSWSGCVKMLQGEQTGVFVCVGELIKDDRQEKEGLTPSSISQMATLLYKRKQGVNQLELLHLFLKAFYRMYIYK